jgi:prevent-host-death family protein
MKTFGASEFKAKCLALIDEVSETGTSIVISKRGRQVAELVPYRGDSEVSPQETLRGTVTFRGDIRQPAVPDSYWEVAEPDPRRGE